MPSMRSAHGRRFHPVWHVRRAQVSRLMPSRGSILLVDDEEKILKALGRALREAGQLRPGHVRRQRRRARVGANYRPRPPSGSSLERTELSVVLGDLPLPLPFLPDAVVVSSAGPSAGACSF